MTRQDHAEWLDRLSDHMDGTLGAEESSALERHLAECGACREALADLRDLVARARALGPMRPSRDLWPGIAGAIRAPLCDPGGADVLPFPRATGPRGSSGSGRPKLSFTVPQAAAAAVAVLTLSSAAT